MSKTTDNSILSKIKKDDFKDLCILANSFDKSVDVDYLTDEYNKGNPILSVIEEEWYKSLEGGAPNYSVYGRNEYLNEAFRCWRGYSRDYLKKLKGFIPKNMSDVKSVLDLGCGIGYTTIGLAELFPLAHIYGSNMKDTLQYNICLKVSENVHNVSIIDDNFKEGIKIDMIFASEFFEHLDDPIAFLKKVIEFYDPKYIVFANSFKPKAIGHFNIYPFEGQMVDSRKISKEFGNTLRKARYKRMTTKFFNNRPSVFVKDDSNIVEEPYIDPRQLMLF